MVSEDRCLYNIEGSEFELVGFCGSNEEEDAYHRDADDDIVTKSFHLKSKVRTASPVIERLGRARFWMSKSVVAKFVGLSLLDFLQVCENHWRYFDQLFECILAFASCGHEEAIYLIR